MVADIESTSLMEEPSKEALDGLSFIAIGWCGQIRGVQSGEKFGGSKFLWIRL